MCNAPWIPQSSLDSIIFSSAEKGTERVGELRLEPRSVGLQSWDLSTPGSSEIFQANHPSEQSVQTTAVSSGTGSSLGPGAAQTVLVDPWDPKHSCPAALQRGPIPTPGEVTYCSLPSHSVQRTCVSPQRNLNNLIFMTAIQIPSSMFHFTNGPYFQDGEQQ